MEINRNNVFDILALYNLKPSKDFGQNFLVEPSICVKIVNCLDVKDEDNVVEVGPGLGSLTNFLLSKTQNLEVVDIDFKIISFLSNTYPNLKSFEKDALSFDFSKYSKVISNLPYNITSDLIVKILTSSNNCKKMVFMCQSENFEHFYAESGSEYGPISVLIHLLGKIKKEFIVKPGNFVPVPKCNSTVFSIELTEVDREIAINTYKFSKALFSNRRKTILNNLSIYLNNKEDALRYLEEAKIESNLRPEMISPQKFKELLLILKNK